MYVIWRWVALDKWGPLLYLTAREWGSHAKRLAALRRRPYYRFCFVLEGVRRGPAATTARRIVASIAA